MKWSKLKSEIENRFCLALNKRVAINSTAYGNCSCGHAWVTLDKEVIANFCTRAFWNTRPTFDKGSEKYIQGQETNPENKKYDNQLVEYGEMSRQDIYKACWEYLHDLSIDEALESDDPLIQTLAVIDGRVGKRRVQKINTEDLHPLAKKLLEERISIESEKKS
ncbi:MAG: hypothetical protein GY694_08840 [Gammaproteobacteria bacterium]|nr:hypothetical protein [Gammaproteobacteria bacterium]